MKLYLGNCEDILKTLPDKSVDAMICDPPYGTLGMQKWDIVLDWESVCRELKRVCRDGAPVLIFADYKSIFYVQRILSTKKLSYKYFFIWDKICTQNNTMSIKHLPSNTCEFILVFGTSNKHLHYYTDAEEWDGSMKFKRCLKKLSSKEWEDFPIKEALQATRERTCFR